MTAVIIRMRQREIRDPETKEAMCRWRQRLELCSPLPRTARSPQKLEETRKDPPLEPLEGTRPC